MADFTSRFNELLERESGSDSNLAKVLGVSKQTISAWKTGARSPKRPTIRTIAEYFGVGVPWLIGITNDETETGFDVLHRNFCPDSPASQQLRQISQALADRSNFDSTLSELVDIYGILNDKGRDILMGTARSLAVNTDMTQVNDNKEL